MSIKRKDYLKHCAFCGAGLNLEDKHCTNCGRSQDEPRHYNLEIECIKCGSKNVSYQIIKKNDKENAFEEELYTCVECGKQFKDKDRLGPSFSNSPKIIIGQRTQKFILFIIIFSCIYGGMTIHKNNVQKAEDSLPKLNCSGLPTMTFQQIQSEADEYSIGLDKTREKYVDNSYIFTVNIHEIKNREITNTEDGNYAFSYITVNKEDADKLSNYKQGDTIKVCGTVTKISWYVKSVTVKNATIID